MEQNFKLKIESLRLKNFRAFQDAEFKKNSELLRVGRCQWCW